MLFKKLVLIVWELVLKPLPKKTTNTDSAETAIKVVDSTVKYDENGRPYRPSDQPEPGNHCSRF